MNISEARHAFITGGASGIGLAMAEAFAAAGVAVTIADVDAPTLESVSAGRGDRWRYQHLDVRDRAAWADARRSAEGAFGTVDLLVNNAGIAPDGRPLADMDPASFDRVLGINLVGVFNGINAFAAPMRELGRGHIVNTASMAGIGSLPPGAGSYVASKCGVVGMTETLRAEMAPHGVGVSVLCPGFVVTNLSANTLKVGGVLREGSSSAAMPPTDVTSADVAQMVIAGIEANRLFIVTHASGLARVQERFDARREGFAALAKTTLVD